MNKHKIEPRALDILESEGLAWAVNSAAAVLRGEGLAKYGPHKWREKTLQAHYSKGIGHAMKEGLDHGGSEQPHTANGIARFLMVLQLELESGSERQ